MSRWPKNAISKLIEIYEMYPCLYNVKCSEYKNRVLRECAMKEVIAPLRVYMPNLTVADVKAKIANIRSQYTAELRKLEESKRSGCSAQDVYTPRLWFFNEVSFLKEHVIPRPIQTNLQSSWHSEGLPVCAAADDFSESVVGKVEVTMGSSAFTDEDSGDFDDASANGDRCGEVSSNVCRTPITTMPMASLMKRKRTPSSPGGDSELDESCRSCKKTLVEKSDQDDIFGKMIASELRNIKLPINKIQLKKTITDAIFEAQMKETLL